MEYQNLADHSRVWIYQSDRELSNQEVKEIEAYGRTFIQQWAAHGSDLQAAFKVKYNRFIVLTADESQVKASGCSIDSSVRFIKEIEKEYQLNLFDRLNITYKEDNEIKMLKMSAFQEKLKNGELNLETRVFNNLVETKHDFENNWETTVRESWHAQLI